MLRLKVTMLLAGIAAVAPLYNSHADIQGDRLEQLVRNLESREREAAPFASITGSVRYSAYRPTAGGLKPCPTTGNYEAVLQVGSGGQFWLKAWPLISRRVTDGATDGFGAQNIIYAYNGEWGVKKVYSEWNAEDAQGEAESARVRQAFIYGEPPDLYGSTQLMVLDPILLNSMELFGGRTLLECVQLETFQTNVEVQERDGRETLTISISPKASPFIKERVTIEADSLRVLERESVFEVGEGKPGGKVSRQRWTMERFGEHSDKRLGHIPRAIMYERVDDGKPMELIEVELSSVDTVVPPKGIFSPSFEEGFVVVDKRTGITVHSSKNPKVTIEELSEQLDER